MRFYSLQTIGTSARQTLNRFPLSLLSAIVATLAVICITALDYSHRDEQVVLWKMVMAGTLGITLFLAKTVFIEERKLLGLPNRILQASDVLVLAGYFFLLPEPIRGADTYRYFVFLAILHLWVAISPFVFAKGYTNAFWQYNKTLFLRICTALLYSLTLYAGLAIALSVTDHLFALKLDGKIYLYLWYLILGIFNTWFFLAGVPRNIRGLEESTDYPRGLKLFTQFVLIPLVTIYFLILYVYLTKIVLTWNLPIGWVATFVICASTFGILALLLVYPIREQSENTWIRIYSKYFYLALFPLIGLLGVAIGRRILDYGITEERYLVLVFALWLSIVALRFTLNKRADIRFIPTSLLILFLLTSWGPLSAGSVSWRSQIGCLKVELTKAGILAKGKLTPLSTPAKISFQQKKAISSILLYLDKNHGISRVHQALTGKSLTVNLVPHHMTAADFIHKFLGFDMVFDYQREGEGAEWFSFSSPYVPSWNIAGYDYLFIVDAYEGAQDHLNTFKTERGQVTVAFDNKQAKLGVTMEGAAPVQFAFKDLIRQFYKDYGNNKNDLSLEKMTQEGENELLQCRLLVNSLYGSITNDEPTFQLIQAKLLLKFK